MGNPSEAPIPMLLTCPMCSTRHIDEGEWARKYHHTHACQNCGLVWRPALVNTVGVRFLPGCKDGKHPGEEKKEKDADKSVERAMNNALKEHGLKG